MNSGQSNIESELSNRNSHAVCAQIAKSKNALTVRDDNRAHTLIGPIRQNLIDVVHLVVVDGDVQAPVYQGE